MAWPRQLHGNWTDVHTAASVALSDISVKAPMRRAVISESCGRAEFAVRILSRYKFVWIAVQMAVVATVLIGCQPHFRSEYPVAANSLTAGLQQETYDKVVATLGPICAAHGLERIDVAGVTKSMAADWAKTLTGTHIVLFVWVEARDDLVMVIVEEYRSPRQTNEGRELRDAILRAINKMPDVRVVDKN